MKICILTHTFPRFPGDSAAPFMEGLASGLTFAGNEVFVLTPFSTDFQINIKRPYKLRTFKYIFPNKLHILGFSNTLKNDVRLKPLVYILAPLFFLFEIFNLFLLVKKEKIDIISAHWILPNGFLASFVSLLTGVPLVSTLPGSDVYIAQKNFLFKLCAHFASFISSAITSNSPQLLQDLENLGADRKKFSTIIYGVDPKKFHPDLKNGLVLRKKLGISDNKIIILGVGRLVAKKGFRYLIEAAPKILQKNKKVIFVIVGEGDQREELEGLIKKEELSEFFFLPGSVDYKHLKNFYNMADIFILPSVRDEKGNLDDQSVSVVEAMACGLPVVTTDFPGYRVVINNRKSGILIPEKNAQEIAYTLSQLISSKKMRESLGKNARSEVLNRFFWPAIGRQYSKLFEEIINKRAEPPSYTQTVPKMLKVSERQVIGQQITGVLQQFMEADNLKKCKNLTCLDIGCSTGVITNMLSSLFKKVVGIDIDAKALTLAQKSYKKNNLTFKVMNSLNLDFRNNQFDVVIANQIYEFVNDQEQLVKEIYRVLKKGGICFVGARNKLTLLEGQSRLPLIHFLPLSLAIKIAHFLKSEYYPAYYLTYPQLKKLFHQFKIYNLTADILKNPKKYNFVSLLKYEPILKIIPKYIFNLFIKIIPNYIFICKKE